MIRSMMSLAFAGLSEEEFYRGMFRALDPDRRGYITEGDLVRHTRPLRR